MTFSVDSSYLIPLLQNTNSRHSVTSADFKRRLAAGQTFVLIPHVLLETFAFLTGTPKNRVSPQRAIQAINVMRQLAEPGPSISLDSAFAVLQSVSQAGRSGGAVYDAHILQLANQAGVTDFLTWNAKDFLPYGLPSIRILTPHP